MAPSTGFEIDGTVYEVPSLDTFNMDEAQVMYDYSGLALEDFVDPHPDLDAAAKEAQLADRAQKLKNPALLRALAHVAYQRGNPDAKPADVRALMGSQNSVSILADFLNAEVEGDAVPPALTTEPEQPLQNDSVVLSTSSGVSSRKGSGALDEALASTTAGSSDTSSEPTPRLSVA